MLKYIKAWLLSCAFFLPVGLSNIASADAACGIKAIDKSYWQRLPADAKALDGDSISFAGKQQLRLLGVNTPERGQPLAEDAKRQLQQWIDQGIYWLNIDGAQDRYGRYLSHLFFADGRSVNANLISKGLGFLVLMPPELDYSDCYIEAWDHVKAAPVGVLRDEYYQPVRITEKPEQYNKRLRGGYLRVTGAVRSVKRSKNAWWLELGDDVVLQVRKQYWSVFENLDLQALLGQSVLASGWVVDRRGSRAHKKGYARFVLVLTHPEHLQLL